MGYVIYQRDMQGTAQVHDLVAAVSYNMLRSLCGRRWRPIAVTFSHARPRDVKPYSRFFKAPLEFDADVDRVALRESLARPAASRHRRRAVRVVAAHAVGGVGAVERSRRTGARGVAHDDSDRTRDRAGRSQECWAFRRARCADSWWRRARAFRSLAMETRYEIARQLLTDTGMAITEIAGVLEYADASAFTRAFRRWTNLSPAAWRAQGRAA